MRRGPRALLLAALVLCAARTSPDAQQPELRATLNAGAPTRAEVVASTDALPAHIATAFHDPVAFTQSASGSYFVFDRRAQAVYAIDKARTEATKLVQIGAERGRIIRPTAFAAEPGGSFVVADEPGGGAQRIQRFADRGYLLNGFTLAGPAASRVSVGGYAGSGIGSLQFTGDSILLSRPQTGSLVEEYSWDGRMRRAFGALRATGQEPDEAVHLALNAGLPLVDPTGGFYFVFQSGVPVFRKYDAAGQMIFERHIEGRELDETLRGQPAVWPKRRSPEGAELPAVPLVIQAAAVDPRGNLWVVLIDAVVYIYSPDGDKVRTVQSARRRDDRTHESLFRERLPAAGHARLLHLRRLAHRALTRPASMPFGSSIAAVPRPKAARSPASGQAAGCGVKWSD